MIWLILLIALVLRLITINQSLWLDEADNIVAARGLDFFSFVSKYPIGDFHPPGYFALIWIWSHIFGFSEISVRMPSILLGVGTVVLIYLIGKELFDKRIALIGSLLLAIAPLHVYYSQEARMYSFSAFSVTLSTYFLIRLLRNKKWSVLLYGIGVILVLYSDYVAYLILPAHFIYLLWSGKKIWKKIFVSWLIAFVAFLPWVFILPQQILIGSKAANDLPGWRKVAGGADLKNIALVFMKTVFGKISFENKIFYGFITALMAFLYGAVAILGIKKINDPTKLIITWLFVPLILATLVSGFIPMLSYFRMVFVLPALYLLIARGILKLPLLLSRCTLGIVIIVSIVSLFIYYLTPKFQREDWRSASLFLSQKMDEKTVVLFEDNHVKFPYRYYQNNQSNAYPGLKRIEAKTSNDVASLEEILIGKDKAYIFDYMVEITDPSRLLEKRIEQLGFTQEDVYDFNGVGFVRLFRRK